MVCFVLGTMVNIQFEKYQSKLGSIDKTTRIKIALMQLVVVITLTYTLQHFNLFHYFLETYNPSTLFSSFLLSLQTNMIKNFHEVLI
jgi:hypothetical protein